MLTQERLKELFNYNPETGIFTRLTSRGGRRIGDAAGTLNSDGYLGIQIDSSHYKCQRLAWLYVYGVFPIGQIDHKDHIRYHNWIDNLRDTSNADNHKNMKASTRNKSGKLGVHWHKASSKWIARIGYNGKVEHLGSFSNKNDAIIAKCEAEDKYGFHHNHGE